MYDVCKSWNDKMQCHWSLDFVVFLTLWDAFNIVLVICCMPCWSLKWLMIGFAGTPWTEEEHRMFLLGLQKLGKGDWRGISRNYVISRTPTQVASHAQKYFIRQTNVSRRKRRSSLFDIIADEVSTLFSMIWYKKKKTAWSFYMPADNIIWYALVICSWHIILVCFSNLHPL